MDDGGGAPPEDWDDAKEAMFQAALRPDSDFSKVMALALQERLTAEASDSSSAARPPAAAAAAAAAAGAPPPRKKPRTTRRRKAAAAAAPSGADSSAGGGPGASAVLAEGWERAVLPQQPTAGYTPAGALLGGGRVNACWAPPVVALARFYRVAALPEASLSDRAWPAGAGGGEITVEAVLGLRAGDEAEEACEVLEDITGCWLPAATFGNDEETESIRGDGDVVWGGPTSVTDYGTHAVADVWWAALTRTLGGGGGSDEEPPNLILLLVERLEGAKDKGHTHYLLVLGCEEEVRRRGGNVRKLWLKDPMVSTRNVVNSIQTQQRCHAPRTRALCVSKVFIM